MPIPSGFRHSPPHPQFCFTGSVSSFQPSLFPTVLPEPVPNQPAIPTRAVTNWLRRHPVGRPAMLQPIQSTSLHCFVAQAVVGTWGRSSRFVGPTCLLWIPFWYVPLSYAQSLQVMLHRLVNHTLMALAKLDPYYVMEPISTSHHLLHIWSNEKFINVNYFYTKLLLQIFF